MFESNINEKIFTEFIDELNGKLTESQKENSLIIFDNATLHKTKKVVKQCIEKKFKILTNIPYKSEYNAIEFFFGYFKNEYYKYCFKNKTEQKNKIKELLESKDLRNNTTSFFLRAYLEYQHFYYGKDKEAEIKAIYEEFNGKNEDEMSRSFEE